jgi:hypothetical protein
MKSYYIPNAVLHHIISETKLTKEYFNRLTYGIGESEQMRTKAISEWKYIKRIMLEGIKWIASIFLYIRYIVTFTPSKGSKLIIFRWNVTKGLIEKQVKQHKA